MLCGVYYFIDWYPFLGKYVHHDDALYRQLRWTCRRQPAASRPTTAARTMRARKRTMKLVTWCQLSITTPLIITPYLLWPCSKKYWVKLKNNNLHLYISTADPNRHYFMLKHVFWVWSLILFFLCLIQYKLYY